MAPLTFDLKKKNLLSAFALAFQFSLPNQNLNKDSGYNSFYSKPKGKRRSGWLDRFSHSPETLVYLRNATAPWQPEGWLSDTRSLGEKFSH